MNGGYDPALTYLKCASCSPDTPIVSFLPGEYLSQLVLEAQVEERIFRSCGDVPNGHRSEDLSHHGTTHCRRYSDRRLRKWRHYASRS